MLKILDTNIEIDVDAVSLQAANEIIVYYRSLPEKCCSCGMNCYSFIRIYNKNKEWFIDAKLDTLTMAYRIGLCCFDVSTKKFEIGKGKNIEINRLEEQTEEFKLFLLRH